MRFGLHSGQHHTSFAELRSLWRRAAAAGFDACYLFDHFRPLYSENEAFLPEEAGAPDGSCLEAFTTLAALARAVPGVGAGVMVSAVGYRPRALLEHSIETLEACASGRIEFGLGAGWFEREYREYGYPFPRPSERLADLERILAGLRARFGGRVRLWTAGTGERRTIPIAARYADSWNAMYLTPTEFAAKVKVLEDAMSASGRTVWEVERSIALRVFCSRDGRAARSAMASWARSRGADPERVADRSVAGTPTECAEGLLMYAHAGASHLAIMVHPPYDLDSLDLLGSEVFPQIRASL